jgi:glycosyltransferase involved in cell wall biosynthesis
MGEVSELALAEAERSGVKLETVPARRLERLPRQATAAIERTQPQVVHLHSVFIPAHAHLGSQFRSLGTPYLVSPHGGLNLWRGRAKKAMYGAFIEKPYLRGAKGIFVLTRREQRVVEQWIGSKPLYVELPNPLPPLPLQTPRWTLPRCPQLVYLGRFDVVKKGLDLLVEIARAMPEVGVRAYGTASGAELREYERLLRRGVPDNMRFLEPVYGDEKTDALTSATIYVQPSRDEGFGMAIVEAMRLAVPVAVTRGCDLAETIAENDLGMVLPNDPLLAAQQLRSVLHDANRLRLWSQTGRDWTMSALAPEKIAKRTMDAYEAALLGPG